MRSASVSLVFLIIGIVTFAQAKDYTHLDFVPIIEALKNETRISSDELTKRDFKSYFSSDRFSQDFRDGKWNGGISAVINNTPFNLTAGSSTEDLKIFQEKVVTSTSFKVSDDTTYRFASRVLSPEVMREFSIWLITLYNQNGFKVEVADLGEVVTFTIGFSKKTKVIPWPIIKSMNAEGGILLGKYEVPGRVLTEDMIVRVRRHDDSNVLLSVETNLGAVIGKADYPVALKRKNSLPIGTVISSILPFDRFLAAIGETAPYNSAKSAWAPADGRAVASLDYQEISQLNTVPDLRGVFIRGLNKFDPTHTAAIDPSHADPDERVVSSFQKDAFQKHTHDFSINGSIASTRGAGQFGTATDGQVGYTTKSSGDASETRPKNVALYFYIKIR